VNFYSRATIFRTPWANLSGCSLLKIKRRSFEQQVRFLCISLFLPAELKSALMTRYYIPVLMHGLLAWIKCWRRRACECIHRRPAFAAVVAPPAQPAVLAARIPLAAGRADEHTAHPHALPLGLARMCRCRLYIFLITKIFELRC
jgi:hypothetical protein